MRRGHAVPAREGRRHETAPPPILRAFSAPPQRSTDRFPPAAIGRDHNRRLRMQVTLKNRETLTGVVVIFTNPFDTGDYGVITAALVVYSITGTTPDLQIEFQTSNDPETWEDCGTAFAAVAAGTQLGGMTAATDKYQRYVRAKINLTGTSPLVSYSLWANLYHS
jgi:hypothetical protein